VKVMLYSRKMIVFGLSPLPVAVSGKGQYIGLVCKN
jgi:hypothetical protein